MSVSLLEASKLALDGGETKKASVIAMFARMSNWLAAMVTKDIPGNAYGYNLEGVLPGVAFRGINESYTESTGIINPKVEALRIGGGDLDVDTAIIKTQGANVRATHENMKIKALAAEVTRQLIKGDSTSNPREFDGMQNRVTGAQLIANGASSGGDALSLSNLDALIDQTAGDSRVLLMNKAIRRRITQASRNTTVGGFITTTQDAFGRTIFQYNNVPILVPYEDNGGTEPLDFTEANPGGGAAASTSIYCVGLGDGYTSLIQNGDMDVRDLGELQTTPAMRTRVEWLVSLCVEHGRAIARLNGVKNAAVVA